MKSHKKFYQSIDWLGIVLLMLTINPNLYNQSTDNNPVQLNSFYQNGEVRLKWMIDDAELFDWGKEVGYTITRTTNAINGVPLTYDDRNDSRVVLASNLKPFTEQYINSNYPNNDNVQAAKNLLYDANINNQTVAEDDFSLAKAMEVDDKKNTQHVFSLITSELDYDAALALGLAYTDTSAEANREYVYSIDFSQDPESNQEIYISDDFESGWGNWNDGGLHSIKYFSRFPYSEKASLALRYGHSSSNTYTNPLQVSQYDQLKIAYTFYTYHLEAGDACHLEISNNGGTSYELIKTYTTGQNVQSLKRYFDTLTINSVALNNQVVLRLRAAGNQSNDAWFFDDIQLQAKPNSGNNWSTIDFNDFEEGFGIWNDGGAHCYRSVIPYTTSGRHTALIRHGGSSAQITSNSINLKDVTSLHCSFNTYVNYVESGDAFGLMISTDGGSNFDTLKYWSCPEDIQRRKRFDQKLSFYGLDLTENTKLRFQSFSNDYNDQFFIDDIKFYGLKEVLKDYTVIETNQNSTLKPPTIIAAYGADKAATIEWDINDENAAYSSFDIERSTNGVNFTKVNDLPYIYGATELNEDSRAAYVDELPQNGITYIYRVCGKSSYGYTSPPSDTIHVTGKPSPLDFTPSFDTIYYTESNDNVILKWLQPESIILSRLKNFDIYRADNITGPYQKLNNAPLSKSTTLYTDVHPLSSGYYKLIANGTYYDYESIVDLYLKKDDTPPAIPIITDVRFTDNNLVQVTWHPVTDEDLFGYRIFAANGKNGNYTQVTEQPIEGTTYEFYVDTTLERDSLYIKMNAQDRRDNGSDLSAAVGISRPDIYPPSPPSLVKVFPSAQGIEISWEYSSSDDVSKHTLQRRAMHSPNWVDVVKINTAQEADYPPGPDNVSYIDSTYSDVTEYEYRFIVEDQDNNVGSSLKIQTTPMKQLIKGQVSHVDIDQESTANFTDPIIEKQLANLGPKAFGDWDQKNNASNTDLSISWKYPLTPELKEFKIYRALTGAPMKEYRTVPLNVAMGLPDANVTITADQGIYEFNYVDNQLIKNRRYVYEIKAVHTDGSVSYRSQGVSSKIGQ